MTAGYREFEFDLPGALLLRVRDAFDELQSAPLTSENALSVSNTQGVYQLLKDERVVYIGKTDSDAGLQRRLQRHARSIRHRRGLSHESVHFKALRIFVFTAMDIETQLIGFYRDLNDESWNNSGFGSNDPGRIRDKTRLNSRSFDVRYPIDLDTKLDTCFPAGGSAADTLKLLQSVLPYTFRVQDWKHPDLVTARATVPLAATTRDVLTAVLGVLEPGWQATALAGRMILYKESVDDYPGVIIGRSASPVNS